MLDPKLTITYQYDDLNRLTQEQSTIGNDPNAVIDTDRSFTHDYIYDTIGNRKSKVIIGGETVSYAYNNLNQLQTESSANFTTAYTYDLNGAQTTKTRTGTDAETGVYGYSLDGRMDTSTITRIEDSQNIQLTSEYTYNSSGIRTKAEQTAFTVASVAQTLSDRTYLIDSDNHTGYAQVLEESVGGTLAKTYTLGDDVLTQGSSGGTVQHLAYDGHGSTRLLLSAAGAIANAFSFDAYGQTLGDSFGATNTPAATLLYAGEQLDPDIQRYYLRARYYNASTGRFNREDPFAGNNNDPQSLHKYAYAHSNPVDNVDPSGLFRITSLLTAISVVSLVGGAINAASLGAQKRTIGSVIAGFIIGAVTTAISFSLIAAGMPPPLAFGLGGGLSSTTTAFVFGERGALNLIFEFILGFAIGAGLSSIGGSGARSKQLFNKIRDKVAARLKHMSAKNNLLERVLTKRTRSRPHASSRGGSRPWVCSVMAATR